MHKHTTQLTYQFVDVRSLRDHEDSDHISMTNFKNLFHKHKQGKQLLDQDEYNEDFGYLVYDDIDMVWYSLPIYDVYFDDNYDDNDNINNDNNTSCHNPILGYFSKFTFFSNQK